MSAARRSEKRRVRSFVRLLDYLICGALNNLLTLSMDDMVAALTPLPAGPPQLAEGASAGPPELDELGLPRYSGSETPGGSEKAVLQWGQPLLKISVGMDPEADDLVFSPHAQDFVNHIGQVGVGRWGWTGGVGQMGMAVQDG